jgi:hypothetical protein
MKSCNPTIPSSCNNNGVCDQGESWKYCCTDCPGCTEQGYLCDKATGLCTPSFISPTIQDTGELTKALNRLADVLERLINLLSAVLGQSKK